MQADVKAFTERIMYHFREISRIPRGSGNEQAVSDFIESFAKGLSRQGVSVYHQTGRAGDKQINNVVVKKPGTRGYEGLPAIALQAHLDMVCEPKTADFSRGVAPYLIPSDPDRMMGKSVVTGVPTTLGADDGIGVACIMAVLENTEIAHPPIEAIFTSDEEDGMSGAANLNTRQITAKSLINIDAEDEGKFFYGCAGSLSVKIDVPVRLTSLPVDAVCLDITISGLLGGHSGLMIDQKRANANRLMGGLLKRLSDALAAKRSAVNLISIKGGSYYNAIPSEANALIAVKSSLTLEVRSVVEAVKAEYRRAYPNESGLEITVNVPDLLPPKSAMDQATLNSIVTVICDIPNDVISWSQDIPGLVETSSNLGILEQSARYVSACCMIRSCVESKKADVAYQMERIAASAGAALIRGNESPAWQPDNNSRLKAVFEDTYLKVFGKAASTTAVHAGLECGHFAKRMPGMDLIAIGPDITGAHSPSETLYLSTVEKIVKLLLAVLERKDYSAL